MMRWLSALQFDLLLQARQGFYAATAVIVVLVGGLLVSQLLTLYITPVYYVYIEGARSRLARGRQAPDDAFPSLDGVARAPMALSDMGSSRGPS